jgi:hypothetical protein
MISARDSSARGLISGVPDSAKLAAWGATIHRGIFTR